MVAINHNKKIRRWQVGTCCFKVTIEHKKMKQQQTKICHSKVAINYNKSMRRCRARAHRRLRAIIDHKKKKWKEKESRRGAYLLSTCDKALRLLDLHLWVLFSPPQAPALVLSLQLPFRGFQAFIKLPHKTHSLSPNSNSPLNPKPIFSSSLKCWWWKWARKDLGEKGWLVGWQM
jgi:hypothetical protein